MQLGWFTAAAVVLLGPVHVLAGNVLKTDGYSLCSPNATIEVNNFNVEYDQGSNNVLFDVSGASDKVQNVTISLVVYAYGNQVYQKDFNPCSSASFVQELCPVPARSFSASGNTTIPSQYAGMIPSIAFNVPNLDGQARLELKAADTGEEVACIESQVTNGKTLQVPAISYVTAAIAAASLALSGVTALATAGHPGATASSPSFGEVIGWFQTVATSGMLSVQYPPVYRAFTSNFAFSTGVIPWKDMQNSIDNFRNMTGGNLTANNYEFLRNSNSSLANGSSLAKRVFSDILDRTALFVRDVSTSTNATTNSTSSTGLVAKVNDLKTWFQQLYIPSSNIFMTVLLFFAIVVAAIAVGILLVKVILETWALYGSFPQGLVEFRKHYWGLLGRTITNLILMLYGIWVLYCVYQFTRGDSWAAKLLAGLTLAAFTAVLAAFAARIWILARRFRKSQGDTSVLYEDREVWRRYSLFYDSYKQSYWWIFIPAIIYSFAKGCIIAGGDGHGLVQTGGQLIVESLMLILLLWSRPYVAKSGQWINITIQLVRVLSVVCILVFVEELGIAQTTKTVTGVVLIAVQSTLTVVLAILIGVNGLIVCIKQNPHDRLRERRGKEDPDADNLTALDARNSLLFDRHSRADIYEESKYSMLGPHEPYRDVPTKQGHIRERSTDGLINNDSYYRGHAREQSGPFRMMDRNRSPSPEELQLREQRPRDFGMAF